MDEGGNQVHDIIPAYGLIAGRKSLALIADRGYDCDDFRTTIEKNNAEPIILYRKNRKNVKSYDKYLYEARHSIENFIGKINSLGLLQAVMTRWLQIIKLWSFSVAF